MDQQISLKPLIVGLLTFVPGVARWQGRTSGGTGSARYCYSVWLRHLIMLHQNELPSTPAVVAELGHGEPLGAGLAALLSGAERYVALDAVRYASASRNIEILDELVELFQRHASIPDNHEFPEVKPLLESHDFPAQLLKAGHLHKALKPGRIAEIRASLKSNMNADNDGGLIGYSAPWTDSSVMVGESVDFVFSQAVLEHVDDLEGAYRALHQWLKSGGVMSHQIDFRSHGSAKEWNGHWTFSGPVWRMIRGRRKYLINRQPLSAHISLMQAAGFEIVHLSRFTSQSNLVRRQLASPFQTMPEEDLTTSTAFIQAIKR